MWLTYSVLAAVSFGLRGILYHYTSQKPLNRNLLLFGTFTMGAIISIACALVYSSHWTAGALVGIQMGLFSFGANASMFKGFAVGKASLVAILTALPSVVVVLAAFALWNERLHAMQLIAFAIIVGGILLVRYSNDISLRNLQGAQWGLLAMLLFAANDLSGKWSTILEAELFPTLSYMFFTGASCFGIWWLRDRQRERAKLRQERVAAAVGRKAEAVAVIAATNENKDTGWSPKRTFLVGLAVGITNVVGMMFIVTAFDIGKAGLVSAVTALNVLIVLLYTRLVVKEVFSRPELAGIMLAFAGIVLMRLFGA
ncbi:DMT family transporter [Paenibacillus harenae]|uniref:Drug/metabolite transporter (DMT)-like permease n=1 Tax=Paenibacillus harenae TaxID=306543 RepID=A0ABT9TZQ7_PAEHA|nr:DMT family transporter [Paenibacillus harenae]MDQ0112346.1 drug/metabolite transporter (DMT)-like permease [Paenibacillus harenae]